MDQTDRLRELLEILFQDHPWHGIPSSADDDTFNAYVEIVPSDTVKYELDKPTGHLRVDRPQRLSSLCPTLYGFVPQTYCGKRVAERCAERLGLQGIEGDGDPMDICILTDRSAGHGGFLCRARPIGGLRMIDGTQADDKILAILEGDVTYGAIGELSQCPHGVLERIEHYFLSYKRRPGAAAEATRIAEVYDRAEALEVIARSQADYRERFGPPEARVAKLRELLSASAG